MNAVERIKELKEEVNKIKLIGYRLGYYEGSLQSWKEALENVQKLIDKEKELIEPTLDTTFIFWQLNHIKVIIANWQEGLK